MRKNSVDMLSGSITKSLIVISLPVMIQSLMLSIFNVVDMTVLQTYDSGGIAVGAVGVCGSLITLITGLLLGVSTGANVVVARAIGEGDQEKVEHAVGSSVAISAAGGIVLMLIGVIFARTFLQWTNCPEDLLDQATLYFQLYFAGVPCVVIYTFVIAILRSTGDSRRPMIILILSGAIKVVFTYVFVGAFHMSVAGVAISTIISWVLTMVLTVGALMKNEGLVKLKLSRIRFYKRETADVLRIGVPAGLQRALYSVANVTISATVNTFGTAATTGISIANQFDGILYNLATAPSLAVTPYVSQNIGAGNVDRARKSVGKGIMIAVVLAGSLGALSAIFSKELSSIMSSDPEVIAYSQQKMMLISSTYFICGIYDILGSALRGMGRPSLATVATLLFMCLLRYVWVYLVFPLWPSNLTFLYLVWPIGWILSIIMFLCYYFPTLNKLKKKYAIAK